MAVAHSHHDCELQCSSPAGEAAAEGDRDGARDRSLLQSPLHHRSPFIRKGAALVLSLPRWWAQSRATAAAYQYSPPKFANSFPKSGTHLLVQILSAFPQTCDYGAFLASMTSSWTFRERSQKNTLGRLEDFCPHEIVRGHLFFDSHYLPTLSQKNVAHYFIYRDPRDVVTSEAHYLRRMNPWHRLHPVFRRLPSIEAAIALSITGLDETRPELQYPNVERRFQRYEGWLSQPDVCRVRYEQLVGAERALAIRDMVQHYVKRSAGDVDAKATEHAAQNSIKPTRSHTFRQGQVGGWRAAFTPRLKTLFKDMTGDLLQRLGYETNHDW